jgi:hypothetical protein
MDIEHAYETGGGRVFEECMAVWRVWLPLQSAATKLLLQGRLPRGLVEEHVAHDFIDEPKLFTSFISTCGARNRLTIPSTLLVEKKQRLFSVPAALAAAWGFGDGFMPAGTKWKVKIKAWGKTEANARILVKRIEAGRHVGLWFDINEYRVIRARFPSVVPASLWVECEMSNRAQPRPSTSHSVPFCRSHAVSDTE